MAENGPSISQKYTVAPTVHIEPLYPGSNPPMTAPADAPADDVIVVVFAEVKERVAIVGVDTEMLAQEDFDAAAGMPAELGGAHAQLRALDDLYLALVPSRPAEEIRRDAAPRQSHEERGLDRGLGDFLVEEVELLRVAIHGDFDAEPLGRQPDVPADEADGIRIHVDVDVACLIHARRAPMPKP